MPRLRSPWFVCLAAAPVLLASCTCKPDRPLHELAQQLVGGSVGQRLAAAEALAARGPRAAPAVPSLVKALSDKERRVRGRAAFALGKVGRGALPAFPALARVGELDEAVAAMCAIAAGAKPKVFARTVLGATKEGAPRGTVALIAALGSMASRCPATARALAPELQRVARAELERLSKQELKLPSVEEQRPGVPIVTVTAPGGPGGGVIALDGVEVGKVEQLEASKDPDWKLPALADALEKRKQTWIKEHPGKDFPGEVLIKASQETTFGVIKRLMYTCGVAGYVAINFAAEKGAAAAP